jgi:uncharacterized protein YcbK (DUF882 family)
MKNQTTRRQILKTSLATMGMMGVAPMIARAAVHERTLQFHNLHTGESLKSVYWANGAYVEEELDRIAKVLRDHRTGSIHAMDPKLMDLLYKLQNKVEDFRPFQVISGYRSPKSNQMLRKASGGVAKRSMHMQGKAIDIRLPGYSTRQLHKAARSLKAGGVGYYAKSDFIHVDTGRVRYW